MNDATDKHKPYRRVENGVRVLDLGKIALSFQVGKSDIANPKTDEKEKTK